MTMERRAMIFCCAGGIARKKRNAHGRCHSRGRETASKAQGVFGGVAAAVASGFLASFTFS